MDWLRQVVGPTDTVYDIGANVGAYSLYAGMKLKEGGGRVYAFEPAFTNFFSLCRNIEANDLSHVVIPFPVAVGAVTGLDRLFLSSIEAGAALHGVHAPKSEGRDFDTKFVQGVYATSLADFAENRAIEFPNHIKIDVDGYEVEVITGLESLLSSDQLKSIVIEINKDISRGRIEQTILKYGFSLARTEHWPTKNTSNNLFVRPDLGLYSSEGRT
jgi:FkbM family methyltransferase